jgi:SAM-dependent methyltransferases related to tRNA (uracil-5-)-methyltransferase
LGDINISDYNFSHVLVDPPRSGLDDKTIEIIKKLKILFIFHAIQKHILIILDL